jgi:hypothetical protein
VKVFTALQRKDVSRAGLQSLFFKAFIAEPHHTADLAAGGHHFCRLHGFGAALGHIEVHDRLFCGRFCGFTHFCHVIFTSCLIVRIHKPVHFNRKRGNVKKILLFHGQLLLITADFDKLLDKNNGLPYK